MLVVEQKRQKEQKAEKSNKTCVDKSQYMTPLPLPALHPETPSVAMHAI